MIAETPSLQRQVQPEGRFVTLIKNEFVKHAKEINRLNQIVKDVEAGDVDLSNYYTKQQTNTAIQVAIGSVDGLRIRIPRISQLKQITRYP